MGSIGEGSWAGDKKDSGVVNSGAGSDYPSILRVLVVMRRVKGAEGISCAISECVPWLSWYQSGENVTSDGVSSAHISTSWFSVNVWFFRAWEMSFRKWPGVVDHCRVFFKEF